MKHLIFLFSIIALAGCSLEDNSAAEAGEAQYELFEMSLNGKNVQGVRLTVINTAETKIQRGYRVDLSLPPHSWSDTLYAEIPAGDTVVLEAIFPEAAVTDTEEPNFKVTPFAAEQ